MKHLKTINELLKSTYKDAASKLGHYHKKSADDLIKWASEKGQDVTQERIYPHRFIFDSGYENEYFFIVEAKHEEIKEDPRVSTIVRIRVKLKSNWNEEKFFDIKFRKFTIDKYNIPKSRLVYYETQRFENKDPKVARQNANHMLKFIHEYIEDELSLDYPDYEIKRVNVHDLYRS